MIRIDKNVVGYAYAASETESYSHPDGPPRTQLQELTELPPDLVVGLMGPHFYGGRMKKERGKGREEGEMKEREGPPSPFSQFP